MNKEIFLEDIHKYIDESYESFSQYQKILIELYTEFKRVCEKNNIIHYVAYGSLLGAIRDNTAVLPWDFDFDTCVYFEDMPRLIKALEDDLDDNFYYESNFNNKKNQYYQLRICPKKYDIDVLHLDVFYLVGAPNNVEKQKKFSKKIDKIFMKKYYKYKKVKSEGKGRNDILKEKIKKIAISLISFTNPKWVLDYKFKRITKKYKFEETGYVTCFGLRTKTYPQSLFGTPQKYSVGDVILNIPEKYIEILKISYGDYNSYMPIETRYNEFMNGYNILKDCEK